MEKLGQLRRSEEWDLVVVDTPPSRSALDFLDAPKRLGRFLDGRLVRFLAAPAKTGAFRLLGAGFGLVTGVVTKVVGAQLLRDVQSFVSAFDAVFGGFQERAEQTYQLLRASGTAFVVVAVPEDDALREASYFVERLAADQMPLAGLVLNRTNRALAPRLSAARAEAAAEALEDSGGHPLTASALRLHAERVQARSRELRLRERFTSAHPAIGVAEVPAQPEDVHDLDGLREIGGALAGPGGQR